MAVDITILNRGPNQAKLHLFWVGLKGILKDFFGSGCELLEIAYHNFLELRVF